MTRNLADLDWSWGRTGSQSRGGSRFHGLDDRARQLHYAPLEGDTAEELARQGIPIPTDASTVVYVQDGMAFVRSRAPFAIASQLAYPWRALSWLGILPAWLTDLPYRLVARTRYRVFGKYDTCPMAPLEHRTRFLP